MICFRRAAIIFFIDFLSIPRQSAQIFLKIQSPTGGTFFFYVTKKKGEKGNNEENCLKVASVVVRSDSVTVGLPLAAVSGGRRPLVVWSSSKSPHTPPPMHATVFLFIWFNTRLPENNWPICSMERKIWHSSTFSFLNKNAFPFSLTQFLRNNEIVLIFHYDLQISVKNKTLKKKWINSLSLTCCDCSMRRWTSAFLRREIFLPWNIFSSEGTRINLSDVPISCTFLPWRNHFFLTIIVTIMVILTSIVISLPPFTLRRQNGLVCLIIISHRGGLSTVLWFGHPRC